MNLHPQPEPIRLGGQDRSLAATHDHAPCLGCVDQQNAISRLEHELRSVRARVVEAEYRNRVLEDRVERMGATPEMGRRKWDFGGQDQ